MILKGLDGCMDKHKKRVVIWISSVALIVVLVLGTLLIIRGYNIQKYTYIPGETKFTFQLTTYTGTANKAVYELTSDRQLHFPYLNSNGESEVWILNEEEIELLFGVIVHDSKFLKWKNFDGYSEDEYRSIRNSYENGISVLTVNYNGENKTIGRYSVWNHDKNKAEIDNMKANEIITEIYIYLKSCWNANEIITSD